MNKNLNYKKLIEENGLVKSWIAKRIGVSNTMLSLFISGQRNMNQESLRKLNEVLKMRGVI